MAFLIWFDMLLLWIALLIVVPLTAVLTYSVARFALEYAGAAIGVGPGVLDLIALVVALSVPTCLWGRFLALMAARKGWSRKDVLMGMIVQCLLLFFYIQLLSGSTGYSPFSERSWLYGHTLSICALYLIFWLAFSVAGLRFNGRPFRRQGLIIVAVFSPSLAILVFNWGPNLYYNLKGRLPNSVDIRDYQPFSPDSRLVGLLDKPSLSIKSNYPRLDGATATFPVYAAVAQAVYQGLPNAESAKKYVNCHATGRAYKMLAEGEVDLVFAAPPSPEQVEYGLSKGRVFTEEPIAYDAFVFLTHQDNPVDDLTVEQIRGIYTQRILNWQEVGGPDRDIMAFQRDEGSGSQTAMLRLVMDGDKMAEPMVRETIGGMGEMARSVVDYRNRRNALGYSFRWYVTAQYPVSGIKLLKVNGIAPSPENIRSGFYPLRSELVVVSSGPLSEESQALLDWIAGPEGQALIEKTGYIAKDNVKLPTETGRFKSP